MEEKIDIGLKRISTARKVVKAREEINRGREIREEGGKEREKELREL